MSIVLGGILFITLFVSVMIVVEDQIEVISLQHWLDSEASKYERSYHATNGLNPVTPNHYEFDFYLSNTILPAWLSSYQEPGFYEHHLGPEDKHFLVKPHPNGQDLYYVVFKDDADDYLDSYENSLRMVTIGLSIMTIIIIVFFGVYLVRQISLPLRNVMAKIELMPPNQPTFIVDSKYTEFAKIEEALLQSKQQIEKYFKREQEFSHFAAHEIRTPLMVLKGSSDILNAIPESQPLVTKTAQRVAQASDDISLLINTFLLLGKEHIESQFFTDVPLHELLTDKASMLQTKLINQDIHLHIQEKKVVKVPPEFLHVLLNNLLKNAQNYASGDIVLTLGQQHLTLQNTYDYDDITSGYGYGLVIVERICERLGWSLNMLQTDDTFTLTITFQT